ncbi:unnamed protein product [Schistosoma mattheei]|uniref:Uncharacterized protein n=1 Tax=Schistosoma mattheei TaxID=31246 RepID=A0A183Q1E7_9TREM|nr:unnamed protein product [Schistosoma mattheei]
MQLDDLDFADDLAFLFHTHQQMWVKITSAADASTYTREKARSSNTTQRTLIQSHLMAKLWKRWKRSRIWAASSINLSPNFNGANNHDDIFERSGIALVISQGPGHTVHINPPTNISSILQNISSQTTPTGHVQSGSGSTGNTDSSSSGNILLTIKHLQAASAVLTTAHAHGDVLDSSWIIFLTTRQHLVWMLNLKIEPSAKLFFKPVQESCTTHTTKENVNSSSDTINENADTGTTSTNITTGVATTITTNNNQVPTQNISMTTLFSVTSELTSLSSMLTQIFIQSR